MISGDKMKNIRLIARLDVKGPNLVKGIQLEGLRKIGNPNAYAKKYYEQYPEDTSVVVDASGICVYGLSLIHI